MDFFKISLITFGLIALTYSAEQNIPGETYWLNWMAEHQPMIVIPKMRTYSLPGKIFKCILESTRCVGTFQVRERQGPQGSSLRHMEQLLLETSCDSPAGIGASLRTDNAWTHTCTDGWTDRRDVGNSILDIICP